MSQTRQDAVTSTTTSALSDLFGRGLLYAGVFALQSVVMIVVTPITVRTVSKYQFGRLVTIQTLFQLLMAVLGFGLGTAIQRLYAEDSGPFRRTKGLLGAAIVLALCATAAVDSTGIFWAPAIHIGRYDTSMRFGVWSAGLAAIAMLMGQLARSEERLGAFFLIMLPFSVLSPLLGLLSITVVAPTATAYFAGICSGELVAVAIGIALSRPRLLHFRDRDVLLSAMALALPLVANGIASQILNIGDRIVVQSDLGQFAVGRYQLAYNAAALVTLLLVLLSQAWLPRVFALNDITLKEALLARARDATYELIALLLVATTCLAPLALRVLAPASYHTNGLLLVVSLVAVSAIPFATYMANCRVLIVFGRTRSLAWTTPTAAIFNIVLNIALVPVWGIDASALATLLAYGLLALTSGISSRRLATLPRTALSVWLRLGAAVAVSFLSAVVPTSSSLLLGRVAIAVACALLALRQVAALAKGVESNLPAAPAGGLTTDNPRTVEFRADRDSEQTRGRHRPAHMGKRRTGSKK